MPRTTTRSTRSSNSGARRSTRSRPSKRGRKASAPLLTPQQVREAGGVVLCGAGLLTGLAMLVGGGPALAGMHQAVVTAFGVGWPIPVLIVLAVGVLLVVPVRVLPRSADLLATAAAVLALFGLLAVANASAGGRLGQAVSAPFATLLGRPGTVVLLVVVMLVGLIVAFHFSPGGVLMRVVNGVRAAYEERRRIDGLVERAQAPRKQARRATSDAEPASLDTPELTPVDVDELPPAWLPAASSAPPAAAAAVDAPEPSPADADTPDEQTEMELRALRKGAADVEAPEPAPSPPPADDGALVKVVAEPEDEDEWADIDWRLPPTRLLENVRSKRERLDEEIKRNARTIENTLETFGVKARVVGVNPGPAVTQFALQPAAGVAVKRIVALQNDLSLALAASPLRIEAPIPGRSAVGIEVPNKSSTLVSLREVVEAPAFEGGSQTLGVALGHDVTGQPIVGDLARMPHLLIAGATGQGKSVCINALICSLLLRCTPAELRLVMVDPKRVELNLYNGLPHLAVPVIVESHQAAAALRWAVAEMDRRYKLLSAEGVRNIKGYNDKAEAQHARSLPYVVVIIDELADLMMAAAGEVEELICRIAQLARAVGIHLVLATQRPSTDIITGLIKANIPSRIAFAVGSQVDSRVILDTAGAEKLLGRGDMLYQPIDSGKPSRVQGPFVHEREVEALVGFWRKQADPNYMEEVLETSTGSGPAGEGEGGRKLDPLFARAARAICAEGTASVSLIQRKFNVGYSRAGRIVDQLAEHRVVGAYQGSKSREILMTLPDVDELLERLGLE